MIQWGQGILIGGVLGEMMLQLWRYTPAIWFCDYGEPPGEREIAPRGRTRWERWLLYGCCIGWSICGLYGGDGERGAWIFWAFAPAAVQLILADCRFQILPDQWLLFLGAMACIVGWQRKTLFPFVVQTLGVVLLLGTVLQMVRWWMKTEVMGMGDVKLLFVLGLLFGGTGLLQVMTLACMACGVGCVMALMGKKIKIGDACPFGPWILGAAAWQLACMERLF